MATDVSFDSNIAVTGQAIFQCYHISFHVPSWQIKLCEWLDSVLAAPWFVERKKSNTKKQDGVCVIKVSAATRLK